MKWSDVLSVCLAFTCSFSSSSSQDAHRAGPTYLITVPAGLLPGTLTPLAVTLLSATPVRVRAEVTQANASLVRVEDTFPGGLTGILNLPPIPGNATSHRLPCSLVVKGFQGDRVVFINTTTLNLHPRRFTTFIQTHKHIYQPGGTVRLRILSIQPDGDPYKDSLNIAIRDPKGNVIQKWDQVDTHLGVVSLEFQLPNNVTVGQWIIVAIVNEKVTERQFTVDRKEPSSFTVLVDTAPQVLVGHDISGTVTAQFSNGQPVQGILSILVTPMSKLHCSDRTFSVNITKEINGSTPFRFNKDLLPDSSIPPEEENTAICVAAYVSDISTGIKTNTTVVVYIFKNTYQLDFQHQPHVLKPNLHFYTQLKISRYDQKPLTLKHRTASVLVEVTQRTTRASGQEQEEDGSDISPPPKMEAERGYRRITLPVPEDGVVLIEFQLQDQVERLIIQAKFMSIEKTLEVLSSLRSPTDSYLQIQPVSPLPAQIGERLVIDIESTLPLNKVHFLVTSRGQVVDVGTETPPSFSLTPTAAWSPEACVTVYRVLQDGEVITDTVHIPIARGLPNAVQRDMAEYVKIQTQLGGRTQGVSGFKADDLVVLTDANLHKTEESEGLQTERQKDENEEDEEAQMDERTWGDWRPFEGLDSAEPWLSGDNTLSELTTTSLSEAVPENDPSGWTMSENLGSGLFSISRKLLASKDISLSLEVPAQMTRGEQLVLEVNIYNHQNQNVEVRVMVERSEQYEFVMGNGGAIPMANARWVTITSQGSATALFPIMPLGLGEIGIAVHAASADTSVDIFRTLLVKPEGIEQSFSQTLFLELSPFKRNLSQTIQFSFPPDVVPSSQRAHVAVAGEILGLSINGLESLVHMPVGCGEQNMIHFAPNVYVLQYMDKSFQANDTIRSRALANMAAGYKTELSYQRMDGSFSAFGDKDPAGSTWLTAFVLRSFLQARPYMQIDSTVLSRAMTWLVGQQGSQGEFTEAGKVIHSEMLGSLKDTPVSLTAYVLVTLLEDQTYVGMFSGNVTLARSYLENSVSRGVASNYSLCLAAYALSLANSRVAAPALSELIRRADVKDGVMTWKSFGATLSGGWQPGSAEIEMVSYVLLTMYRLGNVVEGLDLMKWLSRQRTYLGGYGSTQDTMIALQALTCYAAFSGANAINISVKVSTPSLASQQALFHINSTTYLLQQETEIDASKNIDINVFMEGRGFALFQMNVFYSLKSKAGLLDASVHEAFSLNLTLLRETDLDNLVLVICTRLLESQMVPQSGMVMMDVGMLSGFTLAPDTVAVGNLVRKLETSPGRASLYLDSLTTSKVCISLSMVRVFKVALVQDAVVQVYDYYEPRRRAVKSYNSEIMHNMDSCGFCGKECSLCRTKMAASVHSYAHSINMAIYSLGCLFALFVAVFLL